MEEDTLALHVESPPLGESLPPVEETMDKDASEESIEDVPVNESIEEESTNVQKSDVETEETSPEYPQQEDTRVISLEEEDLSENISLEEEGPQRLEREIVSESEDELETIYKEIEEIGASSKASREATEDSEEESEKEVKKEDDFTVIKSVAVDKSRRRKSRRRKKKASTKSVLPVDTPKGSRVVSVPLAPSQLTLTKPINKYEMVYRRVKQIIDGKRLNAVSIITVITAMMSIVEEAFGSQPGSEKKQIVVQVLEQIVQDTDVVKEDEKEELMFLMATVPSLIDSIIDISKNKINVQTPGQPNSPEKENQNCSCILI